MTAKSQKRYMWRADALLGYRRICGRECMFGFDPQEMDSRMRILPFPLEMLSE